MIPERKIIVRFDIKGNYIENTYHEFNHIVGWKRIIFNNGCTWQQGQYEVYEITVSEDVEIDYKSGLILC